MPTGIASEAWLFFKAGRQLYILYGRSVILVYTLDLQCLPWLVEPWKQLSTNSMLYARLDLLEVLLSVKFGSLRSRKPFPYFHLWMLFITFVIHLPFLLVCKKAGSLHLATLVLMKILYQKKKKSLYTSQTAAVALFSPENDDNVDVND